MPAAGVSWSRRPARVLALLGGWAIATAATATLPGVEPRQRIEGGAGVALTLDACGGGYDAELIATLVKLRVPATLFVTRKWLDAHPQGLHDVLAHKDLFELQNHGAAHVPALVGQRLYGMQSPATLDGVAQEIAGGAQAVQRASGELPRWYRGAGARYDAASLQLIERLNLQVAGYSLNADDGATASAAVVAQRLKRAVPGDIVIAHMNRPAGGTAEGFAAALPVLLSQGVRFVRLSEVRRVVPLEPAAPMPRRAASAP